MNRRADRRPTISTRCQESARGAIAYQLMKTFLLFWKKRLVAGYLKTFIVLVSFFLTAKAESASARKAYSRRSDSGDGAKKCEQKKELGAVGPANRVELVEESYSMFYHLMFYHSSPCFTTSLHSIFYHMPRKAASMC